MLERSRKTAKKKTKAAEKNKDKLFFIGRMIVEKSNPKKSDNRKRPQRQTIKSLPFEVFRLTFF